MGLFRGMRKKLNAWEHDEDHENSTCALDMIHLNCSTMCVTMCVQKAFLNAALNESDFSTFYAIFDTKLFGFTILKFCVTMIKVS